MRVLNKTQFVELLATHPGKRFVFFEYEPEIFKDQFHITTGSTFGAITMAPNTVGDPIIFEYDWDLLADYQDYELFAVLKDDEVIDMIKVLSTAVEGEEDGIHET